MYGLTAGAKWAARGLFVALLLMGLYWCFFYKLQVRPGEYFSMCCLCLFDFLQACWGTPCLGAELSFEVGHC